MANRKWVFLIWPVSKIAQVHRQPAGGEKRKKRVCSWIIYLLLASFLFLLNYCLKIGLLLFFKVVASCLQPSTYSWWNPSTLDQEIFVLISNLAESTWRVVLFSKPQWGHCWHDGQLQRLNSRGLMLREVQWSIPVHGLWSVAGWACLLGKWWHHIDGLGWVWFVIFLCQAGFNKPYWGFSLLS